MAKRKPKAAQWLKVEGQWVKVKVTVCKTERWTRGLRNGGWEPKAKVDMGRRHEIHVVRPKGALTTEGVG